MKIILTALSLTLLPAFAMAECSWGKHETAQSCADGYSWDAATSACVASTTS